MRARLVVGRKGDVLARPAGAGFRGDGRHARQAFGGVILEAGLRLLAIADDVEADLELLGHDGGDRIARAVFQRPGVKRLSHHLGEKQGRQGSGARQASRMCRDDACLAFLVARHVSSGKLAA